MVVVFNRCVSGLGPVWIGAMIRGEVATSPLACGWKARIGGQPFWSPCVDVSLTWKQSRGFRIVVAYAGYTHDHIHFIRGRLISPLFLWFVDAVLVVSHRVKATTFHRPRSHFICSFFARVSHFIFLLDIVLQFQNLCYLSASFPLSRSHLLKSILKLKSNVDQEDEMCHPIWDWVDEVCQLIDHSVDSMIHSTHSFWNRGQTWVNPWIDPMNRWMSWRFNSTQIRSTKELNWIVNIIVRSIDDLPNRYQSMNWPTIGQIIDSS